MITFVLDLRLIYIIGIKSYTFQQLFRRTIRFNWRFILFIIFRFRFGSFRNTFNRFFTISALFI